MSLAGARWDAVLGPGETLVALSPRSEDRREREVVAQVAARLQAGDESVLVRVLTELVPRVRKWCFHLLGPHADLEDAAQDALAEITVALERFEGRSSVVAMARAVTTRTAYRYYGRRRTRGAREALGMDFELAAGEGQSAEEALGERQTIERIYALLETLPPKRRTAIVLCLFEGLSPSEAGEIEGCSAVTMRSRLFEARAELEKKMERDPALAPLLTRLGT